MLATAEEVGSPVYTFSKLRTNVVPAGAGNIGADDTPFVPAFSFPLHLGF